MSLSTDLRRRVIKFVKEGGSKAAAAKHFSVCRKTVYNWLEQPVAHKTGPKAPRKINLTKLKLSLTTTNHAYQAELAQEFGVHKSTICRSLKKIGWSRKKNQAAS